MQARILVGVPAYRGAQHIAETLRCIAEQELSAFKVLISIDNADHETARACEPFLSDPRLCTVVHDRHLGWDRNINWLMAECDCEFFCYWQQDDLATTDYLSSLLRFADVNPDFVCAFADIQWFGDDRTRMICPSLTSFSLTRAQYFLETMNGVPFRGLIRKAAIDRAGPIRHTAFESAHEDFVWLAKLAREGTFGRAPGPLYYKRKHAEAVSTKWDRYAPEWWRGAWMEFGIGMLEAILPAVPPHERETALAVVLERLCCPKAGRRLSYEPGPECSSFAMDFLALARARCGLSAGDDARIVNTVTGLVRAHAEALDVRVTPLMRRLEEHGRLDLEFDANGNGAPLLDSGWSIPEAWGVWSDDRVALLRLPLAADGRKWRVALELVAYAGSDHPQRVRVESDGGEIVRWTFEDSATCAKELFISAKANHPLLTFTFPDAVSPQRRGESGDARALALGLVKATISRFDV